MTEAHARTAANMVMAAAALGAAVYVLRHPRVRRGVWRTMRELSGPAVMWGAAAVLRSWEASDPARAARAG